MRPLVLMHIQISKKGLENEISSLHPSEPLCIPEQSFLSNSILGFLQTLLGRAASEWYRAAPGVWVCSQPWTSFWAFVYWHSEGHPRHHCPCFLVQWCRRMTLLLDNSTQILCYSCFEAGKRPSCWTGGAQSFLSRGFSSKPEISG